MTFCPAGLVKSIQDARTQMDNEKLCMSLARTQKYAEAIAAADAAILEYPNATLVRYCKMNVLAAQILGILPDMVSNAPEVDEPAHTE